MSLWESGKYKIEGQRAKARIAAKREDITNYDKKIEDFIKSPGRLRKDYR